MLNTKKLHYILLVLLISGMVYLLLSESMLVKTTELERIQKSGELVVLTRNTPTTYYIGPEGPTGFEFDLVTAFAQHIGVYPNIIVDDDFSSILPAINQKKAHLAAAGITVTEARKNSVRFADSYQQVSELVLYKAGNKKPRSVEDLKGVVIDVISGSSHEELLLELKKEYDFLEWRSHADIDINYMLEKIIDGDFTYTIADSNDYEFNRRFYPGLRKGFKLSGEQSLAWAFPILKDNTIIEAANEFLTLARENGLLDELYEKHYKHVPSLNYAGVHTFEKHIDSRLEELIPMFKEVADESEVDWRFLAAVSYQESHWNPDAVSPTGVRGLMMLTQDTANELGIENRADPLDSTKGGVSYLLLVKNKIPERIPEPDRTWMALAAYNVGFGHLEDARILTEIRGGNPDRWADVRESLPLLTQKEWYKKTRYGYARGHEPVQYVRNIRNYYDLLVWKYNENNNLQDTISRIIPRVM